MLSPAKSGPLVEQSQSPASSSPPALTVVNGVLALLAKLQFASHLNQDRLLIINNKIVDYSVKTEPYRGYKSFPDDPTAREFVIGPGGCDFAQLSSQVESHESISCRQAAHALNRDVFARLATYIDDALGSMLALGICNGVVIAIGAEPHVDDWFQDKSDGVLFSSDWGCIVPQKMPVDISKHVLMSGNPPVGVCC